MQHDPGQGDPVQEDATPPQAAGEPDTSDPAHQGLCSGECASYGDGHLMHPIRARHTGEKPLGWRDAVVDTVDGPCATVHYFGADHAVPRLWHHHNLREWVQPGDPVRLHERSRVLGTDCGWLTEKIDDGLGTVPNPAEPALWHAETSPRVVDLARGTALPTDRPPRWPGADLARRAATPRFNPTPVQRRAAGAAVTAGRGAGS